MVFRRCVICSDNCDPLDDPEENRNETSLLRLLDINLDLERSTGQSTNSNSDINIRNKLLSLNNSDSYDDLEKAPYYGIYCSNCESRNQEIFELFAKVDLFSKQLEEIKTTLKNDFTNCYHHQDSSSVLRDVDPQDNNIVGLQEKRCQLLRTLIAKSFKLTTDSDDNNSLDISPGTNLQQQNIVDDEDDDEVPLTRPDPLDIAYCDSEGDGYNDTENDFSVEKFVKKRKLRTKTVKGKKPVKSKSRNSSTTTTTTRSIKTKLERKKLVKSLDEEESATNDKIRQKYNNLKDVVVQVEKLPTAYLSKLNVKTESKKNLSTSRVTRGKYNNLEKLKREAIKTEEPKVRLSCGFETCKKTFRTEEEKDYHTKKKHEGITHPFKCPECGRQFRQQKLYDVHVKSHRGDFPFTCKVCKKGFINNGALKSHAVRHTTDTPFKCDLCPRAYKGHGGLVYHKRKVHSGVHPYQCEICGASFVKSDKLTRHKASVHAKDKPIICHICGKTFTIQNYLYMHMRIHQGNPFVNKNRKKSVISSSSSLTMNQNSCSNSVPSSVPVGTASDTEFIGQQQQQNVARVEAMDTHNPNGKSLVPSQEDHYNNNPQIPTMTQSSVSQPRQIILTLDTSKPSNLSHHHLQTDNPNHHTSNSTFVINFNKKALMANPLAGQMVHHDQEPHLLLTTTEGGVVERGGNVIVTTNNNSNNNSTISESSSIHRMETLQNLQFRPTLEFTTISNQILQQATQQGVIQYFPLSSITEQFPNGFEFFASQNNNNTNT